MNEVVTAPAQNNQMKFFRIVNVFRIPDVVSIIVNGFLLANLAFAFFAQQCFKPDSLPLF